MSKIGNVPNPQGKGLEAILLLESHENGAAAVGQLLIVFDDGTSIEFLSDSSIRPGGSFDGVEPADLFSQLKRGFKIVDMAPLL